MRLRATLYAAFFVGLSMISAGALAGEELARRRVVDIGCHNTDGTCYIKLDGSPFGSTLGWPVGVGNEFRFDNGDTTIGARAYASFLAAFTSERPVTVHVEGCTSQGYPNLRFFTING
ncbi:hypothetical protein [Pseudoxanthomonas winnipegensis]|uniref:hypothetical protein n=1 Tax=Pseudoxanthomonas winnipegensis TaxID=2480810 RepID=UPI00103B8C89|nr:hypothetical protein [Pseudoxanthomonas winnipegensis]TBV76311.1 hypothetical protein EYC45_04005 [Pseudoxanthomonas winnipegensis]